MRLITFLITFLLTVLAAFLAPPVGAQFENVPVPAEMERLDFLLGDWDVEWAYRGPDSTAGGALWYRGAGGGLLRFDGKAWTAFQPGESAQADEVLAAIPAESPGAIHHYSGTRSARRVQDAFAVAVDDGSTGGTSLLFFDSARGRWIDRGLHAPTNAWGGEAVGSWVDGRLVFEGSGTDRRGERIFRRTYTLDATPDGTREGADLYTVRTDVSFDEGKTWIEDQIVQTVRRKKLPGEAADSSSHRAARSYLETLLRIEADELGAFYDEETVFEDVVAGTRVEGRSALLEMVAPALEAVRFHRVELLHEFSSGSFTVFVLDLAGEARDGSGGWRSFHVSQAMVVEVEGETVRRHLDFVDYACWHAQREAQKEGPIPWEELRSCGVGGRVLLPVSP